MTPPERTHNTRPARRRSPIRTVAVAAAALLLTASCAGDSPKETQVLGETLTREPSSTTAPPPAVAEPMSTTTPSTQPSATTSVTSATTSTTRPPAPPPCHNPLVGYTVTPPGGWYSSGDHVLFAPCEAFDRQPIPTETSDSTAAVVPIVFRSLGPVHYLLDPAVPARTAERAVLADTRLGGQMRAAGRAAARFEHTGPAGWRTYTYLVDVGPTVLAAQYYAPPGQSPIVYAAGKRALDQLVASLKLADPGCLDGTDRRCGAFHTSGANAPIRVALPAQPVDGRAGQALTVEVTADDPDADAIRLTQITTEGICPQIIDAVSAIGSDLRTVVRTAPASVDGRFGPWRSPPRGPGHATFTVSETFATPGEHSIYLSVQSSNTAFPLMLDPYASFVECVEVKVTVG